MPEVWFTSDTHFFHESAPSFADESGVRTRPFANEREMTDCIASNWNDCVKPSDKIFHLGDVAFKTTERKADLERLMLLLHGTKHLVLGNHDDGVKLYPYFRTIAMWREFPEWGFVCTHIPLRAEDMRGVTVNVHGHLHHKDVGQENYINICTERTAFRPMHVDELRARVKILNEARPQNNGDRPRQG